MPSSIASFQKTHIYSADASAGEILQDLRAVAVLGQKIDATRSWYKKWFFISLLPSILFLVLGVIVVVLLPITLIVVGFCFVCAIRWRKFARLWYELKLGELVERTLGLIGRDMAPSAKISVQIDLRSHDLPEKLKREGEVNQWKTKFYTDPWLKLTGRLLDGSTFRLAAITHLQKRTRWKRSSSGKSKLKSKSKEATVFQLRLRVKPKRYPGVATITNARGAVQLPQGVVMRKVATAADSVFLSAKAGYWDNAPPGGKGSMISGPHTVAMLFLSAYQVLNLSKAMAKAGKSGGGS